MAMVVVLPLPYEMARRKEVYLKTDEHDDVRTSFDGLEGLDFLRTQHIDQFIINTFLDESSLVDTRGAALELVSCFDVITHIDDNLQIDIALRIRRKRDRR